MLPSQDSATGRGLKTTLYSTVVSFIALSTAFYGVLKGVPGCSEAVLDFLQANALQLSLIIGVPTGLSSFVVNLMRPGVKNYN